MLQIMLPTEEVSVKICLKAIIKNTEQPKEPSLRIVQNFDFLSKRIVEQKDDLATVCRGLAKLMIVDITL